VKDLTQIEIERLVGSHEDLRVHVLILTAIVGSMATAAKVDLDELEDCIKSAAKQMRPGWRLTVFDKAARINRDFDEILRTIAALKSPRNIKLSS
jgi:hypothetical protein